MSEVNVKINRMEIYQNNEQTSLQYKKVEPVDSVQMNIYQIDTCRKDLSWLHSNDVPRFQERQHVKHQQSYISAFASYLVFPSSSYFNLYVCIKISEFPQKMKILKIIFCWIKVFLFYQNEGKCVSLFKILFLNKI